MSEYKQKDQVGLIGMSSMIIGSVIGGGVFNLMSDMASVAAAGPTAIALIISGIGMGLFVMSLSHLNEKLPHLDAGIYSYAEEGFGSFVGFLSAFGYWSSIVIGNVALAVLSIGGLSYFFPIFGDGSNIYAVILASILLWGMHFAILKGSDAASKINSLITAAKLLPIFAFMIVILFFFRWDLFTQNLWGRGVTEFDLTAVIPQLRGAMISAVWVYIGIEGAIVYSARAKSKAIVSKANLLSFILITIIYLMTTVGSFGILPRDTIAELNPPAMGTVMEAMVGSWGAALINLGVLFPVLAHGLPAR